LGLGPDRFHGLHTLAHHLEARGELRPVIGHLLRIPARADAEEEAAVRDLVYGGHLLGGVNRITLHDEADPRPHLEGRGGPPGPRPRDEGSHPLVVLLW